MAAAAAALAGALHHLAHLLRARPRPRRAPRRRRRRTRPASAPASSCRCRAARRGSSSAARRTGSRSAARTRVPSRCVWPTNSSSVRGRMRAASGRSAAGGLRGRAGCSSGTSKSRPIAISMGPVPLAPLRTVAREWGRIGVLGFGGPPAHVALLRDLTVDRREWIDAREFEDAFAACSLLPGPASTQMSIYTAQRVAGRGARSSAGSAFILPGLVAVLADRGARARRRAARVGRRASAPAPRRRSWPSSCRPGLKLIDPRRGLALRGRRRARRRLRRPLRGGRAAAVRPGAARAPRAALRRLARADLAGVQGRRALLRRRLRDHPADVRRRRRGAALDDRAGVRQRRRLRADHARAGHPHGRAGRLRGLRAGRRARGHGDRVRAQLRDGHARRAALRAPAGERPRPRLPRRRRPGRRGRDPRRRRPAAGRDRRHLAVGRARRGGGRAPAARPADLGARLRRR